MLPAIRRSGILAPDSQKNSEQHSAEVMQRIYHDIEADTIIGKNHKGAIVTMDERKAKLRVAYSLYGLYLLDA